MVILNLNKPFDFELDSRFTEVRMPLKEVLEELPIHRIITPGNCLGWMKGGFDMAVLELFPNIEEQVREYAFIPIGSSVEIEGIVDVVYSPTMMYPSKVSSVLNAYTSAVEYMDKQTVLPLFGTGFGGMTAEQSYRELIMAFELAELDNFKAVKKLLDKRCYH